MSDDVRLPVDVHLVMWRVDGSILLARSADLDAPWCLPWGGLRTAETAREAVLRIADEAVSVTTMMAHMWLVHVAHHDGPPEQASLEHASLEHGRGEDSRLGLFFRLTHWRGIPRPGRDPRIRRLQWHQVDSLPDSLAPLDREAIERWKDDVVYSEPNWHRHRVEAAS